LLTLNLNYEKHSTKVFILSGTAKQNTKKECFTTYINLQGEIFNVVNKIHKIKKRPLITEKPLQNAN